MDQDAHQTTVLHSGVDGPPAVTACAHDRAGRPLVDLARRPDRDGAHRPEDGVAPGVGDLGIGLLDGPPVLGAQADDLQGTGGVDRRPRDVAHNVVVHGHSSRACGAQAPRGPSSLVHGHSATPVTAATPVRGSTATVMYRRCPRPMLVAIWNWLPNLPTGTTSTRRSSPKPS